MVGILSISPWSVYNFVVATGVGESPSSRTFEGSGSQHHLPALATCHQRHSTRYRSKSTHPPQRLGPDSRERNRPIISRIGRVVEIITSKPHMTHGDFNKLSLSPSWFAYTPTPGGIPPPGIDFDYIPLERRDALTDRIRRIVGVGSYDQIPSLRSMSPAKEPLEAPIW